MATEAAEPSGEFSNRSIFLFEPAPSWIEFQDVNSYIARFQTQQGHSPDIVGGHCRLFPIHTHTHTNSIYKLFHMKSDSYNGGYKRADVRGEAILKAAPSTSKSALII